MKFDSALGRDYRTLLESFPDLPREDLETLESEFPADARIVDHLIRVGRGSYDQEAAHILAAASAWAYSDVDSVARIMRQRGIPNNRTVALSCSNDALLVGVTANIIQSEDGRVVILCFRGTEPQNIIQWLSNASTKQEPFLGWGRVHGGFPRSLMVLWPALKMLLKGALGGYSVCSMRDIDHLMHTCSPKMPAVTLQRLDKRMEALYITGHSLGGALAVLATAIISVDPGLTAIKEQLRGVYTYGQPMVGGKVFAKKFEQELGDMLFRHVYKADIVPRLPPVTMGSFQHFGREFTATDAGWVYQSKPVTQLLTVGLSTLVGALSWIKDQIPLLSWLRVPISIEDHSPAHYLRTSQMPLPNSELL
jgi:lipase (class 3)